MSGELVFTEELRASLRCFPDVPMRDWRQFPLEDLTRAERVMRFIEDFIRVPEGKLVGEPLRLLPFQEVFIYGIYDNPGPEGTARAYLSISRKNGKTCTIAALLMAHIAGPEAVRNSQIVSGAMSRDQAAIVFSLASKMIGLNDDLAERCGIVPSGKKIVGYARNVEYKALSADAPTTLGLSPVLAILDEVGQIRGPRSSFVDAIETAQGAYDDPLLIAISTSAPSDADLFSEWCDDAERDPQEDTVCMVWDSDKEMDILDEDQWRRSNPALGVFRSLSNLRRLLRKAKRLPSSEAGARNLLLNQRVALEALWLAPGDWQANNALPNLELFKPGCAEREGETALGLDLSARQDLTAAVLAAKDEAGVVHLLPFVFTPTRGLEERAERDRAPYDKWVASGHLIAIPGASISYALVVEWLAKHFEQQGYYVGSIEFDRWRIKDFRQACLDNDPEFSPAGYDEDDSETEEVGWHPVGQGYKDITPRCQAFETLYVEHKLAHGNHPLLLMAASNAIAVQDETLGIKLDKRKSTQRIDPLVAAVMAAYQVSEGVRAKDPSSQYEDEDRGVVM